MKKIKRLLSVIAMTIVCVNMLGIFTHNVQAAVNFQPTTYQEMLNEATDFITVGKNESANIDISGIAAQFVPLGQILTMIGAGVMVAVTTYMGIKYLTAGPEAQAKLKEQLIGVVVSGIVIFGAFGIWTTIIRIVDTLD